MFNQVNKDLGEAAIDIFIGLYSNGVCFSIEYYNTPQGVFFMCSEI